MARLLGIVLPDEKRVDYALTLLYGIGWTTAGQILKLSGIDKSKRIKQLSESDMKKLSDIIEEKYTVEGNLKEEERENVKRLKDTGSYRGLRNARGLPSRGQRTRSNARTKRGKRKTVEALTKEAWAKIEGQKPAAK